MVKKKDIIPIDNNVITIPIEEAMPENYLPYAVEVAKERALPDVRDGLKPVHRRILYGAYLLKAFPDRPYYKAARIVGDILGKFHPHGDTSVYDALVILAQNFSTRNPLIDGHGNFGSIDGDGAAAMRYTEARLTNISMEMLRDIDKDTVEMVPNYSDSEIEPRVLPSRYPNLLVNGTFGIAVGLATNIPPHNLNEVIDGVLAYIDNNDISTKELMEYIKGPDLPTGGILIGVNSMLSAYETGEGKVTCRAKTSIETLENGRIGIVISEFPYKRNKAKLLQTISEMTGDKRHAKVLESISDIRDESDRTGIRAVIEFKKSADEDVADKVLKYLFKKTDLQCNISFNMVALANGKPETMGLKTILIHYVNHQKDVITRRTKRELEVAEKRFHIVEGFIKAINILDEVIKTIRNSKSKKDALDNLVTKYSFTENQATAILELMLYRLTGLEITTFQKEYKDLEKKIKELSKILNDEKVLLKVIKLELKEVSDKYPCQRRTRIVENDDEAKIDVEELIVVEDIVITMSRDGFIKRIPERSYARSNANVLDIEYREGDELQYLIKGNTKNNILIFTDMGNMYQIKGINIPEYKWKEKGERIDTIIKNINLDNEKIVGLISTIDFDSSNSLIFITNQGSIKRCTLDKFNTNYSKMQATRLRKNEKLIRVDLNPSYKYLRIETKLGFKFNVKVPLLEDVQRNFVGVQLFNISSNEEIVNIKEADSIEVLEFTIGVTSRGKLKSFGKTNGRELLKVNTNTLSKVLLFTNYGKVIQVDGFMIQEVVNYEIDINLIYNEFKEDEKIVAIFSVSEFDENRGVIIFTKEGFVKKLLLKDLESEFSNQQIYKFKNEDDKIIAVDIAPIDFGNIVIITKKGMAIKFNSSTVNPSGKITSGVTGISLKEGDNVVYGYSLIESTDSIQKEKLKLTTMNKKTKELLISEVKVQNRAGRGNNIMIVEHGDEIKNIGR